MKIFLAKVTYRMTYYDSHEEEETKLHVVRAKNAEDAEKKASKHYEDKTEQYSVYYRVTNVEITEEIS